MKKNFTTSDVDFATFLLQEGIPLVGLEKHPERKNMILLSFSDERGVCLDLERVFLNSPYKKFRDLNKYLLRKIHAKLKEEG